MSSISKAGVWIDCKQLLSETYKLVGYLNNADKVRIGDKLLQYNIDMINHFSMAYNRGDEHLVYDNGRKIYDVIIKGCKMEEVNALQASFESYKALIELTFENLDLSRMSQEKRQKKETFFLTQLGKIEQGITKWSRSIYRQVTLSVTDRVQTHNL